MTARPVMSGARLALGESLIQEGVLSEEELGRALSEQKRTGRMLGEVLMEQGVVTGAVLLRALGRQLGFKTVVLRHGLADPALLELVGEEEARRLDVLPMFRIHNELTVAMAEPQSLPTIDRLRALTGCRVRPVLASAVNIREFIGKIEGTHGEMDEFLATLTGADVEVLERERVDEGPATDLDQAVSGSPIVNLVNMSLLTAIKDGASDIHIEPHRGGTRVRYRIDGVLRDLMEPPAGLHGAIVSRVKVIAKMDIAEKRLPQEGRVRIVSDGRDVDLRVSSMPTLLGEKLVIRVLDKSNLKVRLEELGFRMQSLVAFKMMLRRPHGLVLVTGPTGSGKTTTLYSALDLLRSSEVNVVTVEDPVEYQLDLVNQVHVQDNIGLSFPRVLRSILRQDPDIIMVGEIRDEETARVAVQAALTGHLVLATLHTNDAPGTISRLFDMNVEPYLLSGALNGVVAQRLARTICRHCETKYYPDEHLLHEAGLVDHAGRPFRRGLGCAQCHDSGFAGRIGIYEVMVITPTVRHLVHHGAAAHELRRMFREDGGMTLRDEGVLVALDGKTSLEEVLRVTHTDGDDGDMDDSSVAQETMVM